MAKKVSNDERITDKKKKREIAKLKDIIFKQENELLAVK